MAEIKPRFINGEPVCSDVCPTVMRTNGALYWLRCPVAKVGKVKTGIPCIPGLRQQRDERDLKIAALESAVERAHEEIRELREKGREIVDDLMLDPEGVKACPAFSGDPGVCADMCDKYRATDGYGGRDCPACWSEYGAIFYKDETP
jgi:hypothetical protein